MALVDSLISYWKLDESSGSRADSFGTNTLTDTNSTPSSTGKISNAASFNGATNNRSLSCANTPFNFENTQTFSASIWLNSADPSLNRYIIGTQDQPSGSYRGWYITHNGAVRVYMRNTLSNAIDVSGSTTLSNNTWYHVVYTYDGSKTAAGAKIYVNGNLETPTVNQNNLTGTTLQSTPFVIGLLDITSPTVPFDGLTDEAAVWSRVLTSTEVTQLYGAGYGLAYPLNNSNRQFKNNLRPRIFAPCLAR